MCMFSVHMSYAKTSQQARRSFLCMFVHAFVNNVNLGVLRDGAADVGATLESSLNSGILTMGY